MKITLLNDDNALGLDGVFYSGLDFSNVPDNIHAIQWNGTKGEIEFYTDEDGEKPANQKITELPDWVMALKPQWDSKAEEKRLQDLAYQEAVAQAEAVNLGINTENAKPLPAIESIVTAP